MDEYKNWLKGFIMSCPIPVEAQFNSTAWKFMQGTDNSRTGDKGVRQSIANFLWYHLGACDSNYASDKEVQDLRKKAFSKFGESLYYNFPNCSYWKGKPIKVENANVWSTLMENMGARLRGRKKQLFRKDQPDMSNFWLQRKQGKVDIINTNKNMFLHLYRPK